MKYMLIMRATDEAWAAFKDVDFNEILTTMGKYNDELIKAGVLVAAEGLADARTRSSSTTPRAAGDTDGPTARPRSCSPASGSSRSPRRRRRSSGPSGPAGGPGSKVEIRRVATSTSSRRTTSRCRGSGVAGVDRPAVRPLIETARTAW